MKLAEIVLSVELTPDVGFRSSGEESPLYFPDDCDFGETEVIVALRGIKVKTWALFFVLPLRSHTHNTVTRAAVVARRSPSIREGRCRHHGRAVRVRESDRAGLYKGNAESTYFKHVYSTDERL
jgi:hypothetical protein